MVKNLLKHRFLLIIPVLLIILISSSFLIYAKYNKNQYQPKVLIIYTKGTTGYLDIYQNYNQSYILNTRAYAVDDKDVINKNLSEYDVVYPDTSLLSSENIDVIKPILTDYVSKGGSLFLENEWHNSFSEEFTGVTSYGEYTQTPQAFTYPEASYNLNQLQLVVKSFLNNFTEYRKDDFKFLKFNSGKLKGAKSIANIGDTSILSLNKYKNGHVLMASSLLPNKSLITGFDLKAKDENQKYFDYTLSTVNYFVRNEFLAFSLKEKDGYVLKKVLGPYGRPAMAWQNHYEALTPIKDKEGIKFIDLLKEYNEIPSYSLIRSSYDWGQWKATVSVHLNQGTKASPSFKGEVEDSYYSSGSRIMGKDDYITFGDYPDYKSLNDPIEKPHRAYPAVVDFDNNGNKDLIVGSTDGKMHLLRNIGDSKSPSFSDKEEIRGLAVSSFAAPAAIDVNKDGFFDVISGSGDGRLYVFINKGSSDSPLFSDKALLKDVSGIEIKTSGDSAPSIGDIDSDGRDDLLIGSSSGSITIYTGSPKGFVYSKTITEKNIDKFSAPSVYDWNNDGLGDILVGDNSGMIKILLNSKNSFSYSGEVTGQTTNPKGSKALFGGHNSVPVITDWNGDSAPDIIIGQLEFGLPYDIDSKLFKYKNELKETVEYSKEHGVPIYPHFFTHKYKDTSYELNELKLHKKAFESYNIPWTNTGTDQHTWRTNSKDPQQTLLSAMNSGIWWNFGFNPPNQPDLPRDGKEFLWSTPFLLSNGENTNKFLTFTPSPNLFMYPRAYESFSALDMPITYFEHIEYRFKDAKKNNELKEMAAFLDKTRDKGEYNFMTQDQMAKSFITAITSKAKVYIRKGVITIKPETGLVPGLAGEYKNTLGIELEKGEKSRNTALSTSSPIHFEKDDNLYFGVGNKTKILFNKPYNKDFYIVRSNVPVEIKERSKKTEIKFLSTGMQQIKLYSKSEIKLEGERIKVEKDGNFYTVTHYGYPITITALK